MKSKFTWLLILLIAGFQACTQKEARPPNIIFIMADDHASKAISAYDTSLIRTPHIDRLADEGIRFDNCFCTNAICAPSRAVILTGKYSHINGVLDNSRSFDGRQQTMPKILRKAGYQTAMVGKWHLKSEPTGFDHWLVLPGQGQYYNPDFIGPEGRKTYEGYVTDIITEEAISFLDSMKGSRPFFMMLHHKAPHRNWQPRIVDLERYEGTPFPIPSNLHDDYRSRSDAAREQAMTIARHMSMDYDLKMREGLETGKAPGRELLFKQDWGDPVNRMPEEDYSKWKAYYLQRSQEYNQLPADTNIIDEWKYKQYMEDYLSCISTVDENIGILLDYLKESGLDKNTVVIYTSDQGFFLGEHGWFDKRFMYEEAYRMPLIIRMPGREKKQDSHMITNADFAPTILDLAGIKTPDDMQGESFAASLHGDPMQQWRDAVYYHYFEYPAVHSVKRHYGIRTERYKLIHFYYDIDAWELYDLKEDPHEMNNLYGNPEYADIINKLKEKLAKLQEQYDDTDPQVFLPVIPDTIAHLGLGKPYTLLNRPHARYTGKSGSMTDGIVYPEGEAYQFTEGDWYGFRGDDLAIQIDLGEVQKVSSISTGFLQDHKRWIFLPMEIDYYVSADGKDYMDISVSLCSEIVEDQRVMKVNARVEYPQENIRYIRVEARNNTIPAWHAGAGKPAWLFADEIIIN